MVHNDTAIGDNETTPLTLIRVTFQSVVYLVLELPRPSEQKSAELPTARRSCRQFSDGLHESEQPSPEKERKAKSVLGLPAA